MPPTRIGPFLVLGELGRGGMGEVYLARDPRLDRKVAIKSLPAHLAQDAERLSRFEREARVLASLTHPGIGAIYGLEEQDGQRFLVLEYIEGETLASRLKRGPLDLDQALDLARQLAAALEAAHEKGVIHRDLKPGNLMVAPDGVLKVLDFGLARTADPTDASLNRGQAAAPTATSPTLLDSPTIPGAILGTAGYMSPEQVRGKPIDKRVDIFAFGCILYELLVGRMPFSGETLAEALASTLHHAPDLGVLPSATPRRVRDLLASCLAKDRSQRLRDIGDARLEIERAISEPADVAPPAVETRRPSSVLRMAITCAAGAVAVLAAMPLLPRAAEDGARRSVVRTDLLLPPGLSIAEDATAHAISPDGNRIVLALAEETELAAPRLFIRDLASLDFRELPGTEGAGFPFWSPDGRSIAFFSGGKLKRIDTTDSIIRTICDAPAGRGGAWSPAGTIVFAPSASGPLSIVDEGGGVARAITASTTPSDSHRLPQMLPDGRSFIYMVSNSERDGVQVFDADSGESRFLFESNAAALFVAPEYLVYPKDENLLVQRLDLERLVPAGAPVPLTSDIHYQKARGFTNASISADGTLVYALMQQEPLERLEWLDSEGNRTPLAIESLPLRPASSARLDRTADRVLLPFYGDRGEEWVEIIDLRRGIRSRLGNARDRFVQSLAWAPDGDGAICATWVDGIVSIEQLSPGGGRSMILRGERGNEYLPSSVSPDGRTLLFTYRTLRDKRGDIFALDLAGGSVPRPLIHSPDLSEAWPDLSPKGDFVAFLLEGASEASRTLMVATYPEPSRIVQVSRSPVLSVPCWMSENELCWTDESRQVWSATVSSADGRGIEIGVPRRLFGSETLGEQTQILEYDIERKRFLISTRVSSPTPRRIVVVQDWRAVLAAPERN